MYDARMTSGTDMRIRRGGVALWRQIADVLREEIESGIHRAGTLLPGEVALGERFAVNRHTVRRALRELAGQGLVRPERGRGTVVGGGRIDYPIGRRTRFSEIVSAQAREPEGRFLSSCTEAAADEVAAALACAPGDPVLRLETLSLASGQPMSLATHWFPLPRFEGLAERYAGTGSITKSLAACGVADYVRRETRITARSATPEEATLLAVRVGAPLLVSEALNTAPDGTPTHVSRARMAGERVQLVVGEAS